MFIFTIASVICSVQAVIQYNYIGNIPLPLWDIGAFHAAYWNHTLFILYQTTLYQTPFILDVENWNKVKISKSHPIDWTTTSITSLPNYPTGFLSSIREGNQRITQIDNLLYGTFEAISNKMIIFDMETISWINISSYEYQLGSSFVYQTSMTNNRTHLFAFARDSGNTIKIYNIAEDTWSIVANVPSPANWRVPLTVSSDLSLLYTFGSQYGGNTIHRYKIATNSWTLLNETLPFGDRKFIAITASQNKIFTASYDMKLHINIIFDVNTETIKPNCNITPSYKHPSPFFDEETNFIFNTGGGGNQNGTIGYLPMDLFIKFNPGIFNISNLVIHAGKSNNMSCLTDIAISPVIISTDFDIFEFHLYIENMSFCALCDIVDDDGCFGCYYYEIDDYTNIDFNIFPLQFPIIANQKNATATICRFIFYPQYID
eukprot:56465_1